MLREVKNQTNLPALQNISNPNLWGQALYPLLGLLNTFRKPFQDLRNKNLVFLHEVTRRADALPATSHSGCASARIRSAIG